MSRQRPRDDGVIWLIDSDSDDDQELLSSKDPAFRRSFQRLGQLTRRRLQEEGPPRLAPAEVPKARAHYANSD